jgi:RNA polymerase sigma-B factor
MPAATAIPEAPTPIAEVRSRSRDDVRDLHRAYADTGDRAALEALMARYQPLVRKLASRYRGAGRDYDDLLQVGQVGLFNALRRFDPDRGLAFSSFAVPTVLGELRRFRRDTGWAVRVPRTLQERSLRLQRAADKLARRDGRAPTPAALADELDLTEEEVLEGLAAHQLGRRADSLDAPVRDDDGGESPRLEGIGDTDEGFDTVEHLTVIDAALRAVPAREREILRLRFAHDLTQAEIAERVGVSQMQISRLLRRTVARLRTIAAHG